MESMNFWALTLKILSAPVATWEFIAKNEDLKSKAFSKYYLPALGLSLIGGVLGQVYFGIYIQGQRLFPEVAPLLLQTIFQGVFLLLLPFVISRPLSAIAARFYSEVKLETIRRIIIFSYYPALTFSAIQFVPLVSLATLIVAIYSLYIYSVGIGVMLSKQSGNMNNSAQLVLTLAGLLLFFVYFIIMGVALYMIATPYPGLLELLQG